MTASVQTPMLPQSYRVRRVKKETYDTFTLELEPENGNGFSFAAGQFNMLYVFGLGEVPISISGDPTKAGSLIHTTRAVGTVTKAMWKLKANDLLGVRGPFGSSWPVEEAIGNDVVIVTGGIGLAPLRPVIYSVLAQREKFGRVVLCYGARSPEDILYWRELEQWRARFDMQVRVTVDRATASWHGNVGVVTTLIARANFDPLNAIAFVCGPEIMMRYALLELQKLGMEDENIYISMERNMKCGQGFCGHCQLGPAFICKDGPVFSYAKIKDWFGKREI